MKAIFSAATAAGALALSACGTNDDQTMAANDAPASQTGGTTAQATLPAGSAAGGTANNMLPGATGPGTALGLTRDQLEDADLGDMDGRDLGDVEGVVTDAGGNITHLVVEIEDTSPDRYVHVPIEGLRAVRDGTDWDVQGNLTRDQLLAMPSVER